MQGQRDVPINETGRAQARENGRKLLGLVDDPKSLRFVASPLGRTRETMNIVRLELGLPSHGYETDDRIKEISFGLWETHTVEDIAQVQPEAIAAREQDKFNFQPPQGESYAQLLQRVASWLPYMREDAVVVCHGGVLRVLDHLLNGTPTEIVTHKPIPQDKIYRWENKKAIWI